MTIINLIGYSAMAGAIGGGGLGDLAIRFGYTLWLSRLPRGCAYRNCNCIGDNSSTGTISRK